MLRRGATLFASWNNDIGLISPTLSESDAFSRFAASDQSVAFALASPSYSKSSTIESIYATALPQDGVGAWGHVLLALLAIFLVAGV